MSVRGEFRRLVSDTIACLRACDDGAASALADRLETSRSDAAQDLVGAAEAVLEGWAQDGGALTVADTDARARLDDAADRMLRIARIVLGR